MSNSAGTRNKDSTTEFSETANSELFNSASNNKRTRFTELKSTPSPLKINAIQGVSKNSDRTQSLRI